MNVVSHLRCWALGLFVSASLPAIAGTPLPSVELNDDEISEIEAMAIPLPPPQIVDFDGMRERRVVRILVPFSQTFFSVDLGRQQGLAYSFGVALEQWLNKHYPFKQRHLDWRVMFIPLARDQLLPQLNAGYGDLAAGGLTITEQRLHQVDFSAPVASDVREVWVSAPLSKPVTSMADLAGLSVMVRQSSSYYEHLKGINAQLKAQGLAPVNLMLADENLESEDLLEMVNAGLIPATVVDDYLAQAWGGLYSDLQIEPLAIHEQGELAWAIRQNSPQFKAVLARFVQAHKIGTLFGNQQRNSLLSNSPGVLNAVSAQELKKFNALVGLFREHADTYGFDYLMLMAQGYQESQLDQSARSHMGAVGIMQILPSTAADPNVAISGVSQSADKNIEAGSKYMRLLADTYLNEPEITAENKTLLSFAAYNAGPGNLRKMRRLAEKMGLDSDVWFGNVEHAAARVVGQETVDYVGNVYKYYVAYRLVESKRTLREEVKEDPFTVSPKEDTVPWHARWNSLKKAMGIDQ